LENATNDRKTIGMNGSGFVEMLARQMTADLQAQRDDTPAGTTRQLIFKGVSFGVLTHNADGTWNMSQVRGLAAPSLSSEGTTHDPLHLVCDLIAFNSSLVVLFLFAWRFWNDIHWKRWSVYSIANALLMMAFLTAFGFANHVGGPAGAMEKLATATRTLWSALLTAKLLAGARLDPQTCGE
jgi:hypothetical protein